MPVRRFGVGAPRRVAAVLASRLLETGPEEAFNRLTRLGSTILGTPIVALTVVDDVRSFLKGAPDPSLICGPGGTYESPIEDAACHLVVESGEVISIPDTGIDPRVRDLPQIRDFAAASWVGVMGDFSTCSGSAAASASHNGGLPAADDAGVIVVQIAY